MKLIIASNNAGKIAEIKEILSAHFEEIISQGEAGITIEPNETGTTFYDNALIKARAIKALTPYAVLSDDSGLEVDALDGAPGVFSARFASDVVGEGVLTREQIDCANNQKLLNMLNGKSNRKARFKSVVIYLDNDGIKYGEGACEGEIAFELKGENGFGYDPLFYSYDLNKTFAQAISEEKNLISHRKRALADLLSKL